MTATKEEISPKSLAGLKVSKIEERDPYLNILVYGNPGAGKTVLAGSADQVPEMRPVLFLDVEAGTESLRNTYPNVETVRVSNWMDVQNVYNELHAGGHGFNTVVLDSLTEIQKFSMYSIMGDLVKRKSDADPDVPGMREWGKNIEQIRRFVRGFRDLPMNTIFTALMKSDRDSKTGMVQMKPYLSGKLADEVAGFLDVVVYYYVKQIGAGDEATFRRLLLTQATEQQVAKDRTGKLPMVVEDPTMASLYEFMFSTN